MLTAAELIVHSRRTAVKHKALASKGVLKLEPGSVNTVPGKVQFTLDVRAPADQQLQSMLDDFDNETTRILQESNGCTATKEITFASKATKFHHDCIACVEQSASARFPNAHSTLTSGAGEQLIGATESSIETNCQ
jgi:acetylornithine deacetylase/succinyl-diaminopimelate desuccinylase-like protein